jgi:hypothetical protein
MKDISQKYFEEDEMYYIKKWKNVVHEKKKCGVYGKRKRKKYITYQTRYVAIT